VAKSKKTNGAGLIKTLSRKIKSRNEKPISEWKMKDFVDKVYLFGDGCIYRFIETSSGMEDFFPDPEYDYDGFRESLLHVAEMFGVLPEDIYNDDCTQPYFSDRFSYKISAVCYDATGGFEPNAFFDNGGEFLFWADETVKNYCDRNLGGWLPVIELPYEIWEAFEDEDIVEFNRIAEKYPEMKSFGAYVA